MFLQIGSLLFILVVSFATYKLISLLLKKNRKRKEILLKELGDGEEYKRAIKLLTRKNVVSVSIIYLLILFLISILLVLVMLAVRKIPYARMKSIGSYELFRENNIPYYGKHDYSIFCSNNGIISLSTYKIFDKKNKSVFETNSYDEFVLQLEDLFRRRDIQKINFYGTCISDPGYKSLEYALNNSKLIVSHEIENFQDGHFIHIETINNVNIIIEYLWEDVICTCKGA